MAHGEWKPDGERSWSTESRSERVAGGEYRIHEYEGDEQLDAEDLSLSDCSARWTRGTQLDVCIASWKSFKDSCPNECANYLDHDVQHCSASKHKHTHNIIGSDSDGQLTNILDFN